MGVTIETWRARIGLHSQPNKSPRTTTTQGMVTGGGSFPCRPRHVLLVIGLLLLLSGNVELNPGPSSRRQQPPQQNTSSKLYTNKEESFTTTEVLEILQNPDLSRVINQPPVKPRAGQAFLYHFTDANKRDDWRCDQYHFHHDATREQPKADPKFKKLFFVIKTRVGKDKRFKKHAYILLGEDNNLVLFQYIGNERIAEVLPHGNSKNTSVPYTRLCPSVIRAIKDVSSNYTETLRCLNQQASSSTVPEVYKPRSRLHVMNTRYRGKRDCTKEARTNRLGITGDKTTYNLTAFLTKDIEVGKVFPRKGKRKQPKRLKNLQQISCKQIVRAPLGCLPYDERVHGSQDDLEPQEGTRNKNTTPQTPLGFDLVPSNDDSSAADNDNKPSLESETSQASKHYHSTSDESNAIQMANRDNTDLGASEAVDFLKNILEDQCITSKNSITVDALSQHFEENNFTHSLSEDGDFQVSCQDNNQSNSDIAERNSGETTLTQTAPDPEIENVNNEETQIAPLEKFIHVIFNNGQLSQMIKQLQHLHSIWHDRQQQHKAAEDQAVESVASADEQTCFNDNGLQPRMLSTSLPFTASTLITQVRRLWMSDFKTTSDCLLKTENICSIVQQNINSDTMLSLLTSLVVGAFNMQTDIVEFVETLKERPGHLEPPGNNIIADVSNHVRYRIGSYTVTGQDVIKLNKTSWLDDSVIHAYLSLLEERFSEEGKKVFIFDCFLAKFWEKKNYGVWLYKEVTLMEYTWILMPICRHSHWILLAANIREGSVCVINSKPSDVTQREILHHWSEYMTHRSRETRENLSAWREIQCPIFPKTDGSSCGVFILMAAEALLSGVAPCAMRNCHVTGYREYVKQEIVNAAVVQAGDIEESNVQSSEEVEIIESSSSTNQNTRKLHAETENRRKSISTGTSVIDSQQESVICEELVDGISDMKMEPSTVRKQERLDTSGGMTEDTNFIVGDSIHTMDLGSMEIEATSAITPSDLHDTTPGACPADLRSYCEELFQNQKSSFVALTLVCLMKGHLQLTSLECEEHSSPLKDYIKWGCQLCICGETTNAQIRNAFIRLEKLVLISNMNTCVTLRSSEIQKTISTVIADHLQEYIDIIDLKFIYHYLRIHTQDGGFHVWLKGKMVKDLARRFAKEVLQNNLALVLSHDSCGYFHFNVMLRKAVQHLLKSEDFHSILENTDKTFGGTFIHWMCFGRNAELFKSLSFWLTDSQKACCLIPCCISGNSTIVQLLCSETDLTECQKIPKHPQSLPGITHKMESPLAIIESYGTHALPPLHLSSLYGHTGVVSFLLVSGFDVNEQLVDGSGNSIPFHAGSTAALVAATMGNIDIVKCLIQHSADLNLHDIMFNAPIHSACRSGNNDLVALISRQCCISEGDAEGDTPLHIACERGDVDIVSMLLERGADCTLLNYKNEMPLDIVCKKGFLEVAEVILNQRGYPLPYDGSNSPLHKACIVGFTDIIELLLEYDADRSVTVDDQHPLLIAAYSNNIDVVQMLVHMNAARVVLCDTHITETCLRKGHILMVKLLLENQACVSGTGVYSPLAITCKMGAVELVKLLLEKGASVTGTDMNEYSALASACERGDLVIVKLLLEKGVSVSGTDRFGYSALAGACKRGHVEIVKLLLEKVASMSGSDMYGYSPLAIACDRGDIEIVKLLLEKGASVSGSDRYGSSALATACWRGHIEIVKLLLEKGASVSGTENYCYSALASAFGRGDIEIVKLLLEKGVSVSGSDIDWDSALASACERGDVEIVKLLLEKGASVSGTERYGYPALAISCGRGDIEIIKLLLEKGVSVSGSDIDWDSALASACESGGIEIVKLLLEKGVSMSGSDIDWDSALASACETGDVEIVKLLLEKGVSVSGSDIDWDSALASACETGDVEIVKLLLEKGASVSGRDRYGYSALTRACDRGDIEIVKLLLEKGVSVSGSDMNEYSALAIACDRGDIEIVKLLLEKGASVSGSDRYGSSALATACWRGHIEIVKLLLEKGASVSGTENYCYSALASAFGRGDIEIVKLLLEKGVSVSGSDIDWDSALASACERGDVEIVKLLLEKGASVSGTERYGYPALAISCGRGDIEIIKLLLEKGVSVSGSDIDWDSALASACESGGIEIVKLLLEKGVSMSGSDIDWDSALASACETGDVEIVKLLLEKGVSVSGSDIDWDSALASACETGDVEIVKLLLEKGASVSGRDRYGYSALTRACDRGDIEIVKLLLEKGVSVSGSDMNEYSALTIACKRGDIEIVKLLLEKGASVAGTDKNGYSALASACETGDVEIVKLLLEKGASVSGRDRYGYPALALSCGRGDIEIIKLLLEKGVSVSGSDIDWDSALASACESGGIEIVKLLLEKGVSMSGSDIDWDSALASACETGDVEIVKLLLEKGVSVSGSDIDWDSALASACETGDVEIVKLLLEKGASVSGRDRYGYSALTRACDRGDIEIVKLLLEKGVSVSGSDMNEYSALTIACKRGDIEIVKLLLEKGASVAGTDKNGYSALASACKRGDIEIVKLLLEKGDSVSGSDIEGYSALAIACERGDIEIVKLLLEKGASVSGSDINWGSSLAIACETGDIEIVKLLLEKGASVSGSDRYGYSALSIACGRGDIEIVKLLLEKGASVSGSDIIRYLALNIASGRGDKEIVKLLLEKEASVSGSDIEWYSALVSACERGDIEIVKLLLEKGVSVAGTDMRGNSPLTIACGRGDIEIVKLLLEKGVSVSGSDIDGYLLLTIACDRGQIEIVKLLLEKGASVSGSDIDGYLLLAVACERGDIEIVKLLLEKGDVYSLLAMACANGDIAIVKLLLEKGVSVSGSDIDGYLLLTIACDRGQIEIVKLLLEKGGVYSLLAMACANGDIAIVKLLLEIGAREPSVYRNFRLLIKRLQNLASIIDIQSLLKWVLTNKYFAIFRMLLTILPPDAILKFFLHEACHHNSPQTLLLLTEICDKICLQNTLTATESLKNIKCIEILKLLNTEVAGGDLLHFVIACGNINLVRGYFENFPFSDHADTCVIIASRYGHTAIVEYLLHKCNNNITSNTYSGRCNVQNTRRLFLNLSTSSVTKYRKVRTALYEACYQGHIDIVRLLLQYDMYRTDQYVYSSLHLVCRRGNIDMLQLLLDSEAYVDHVDKNGNTGLYICTKNRRVLAMQLLLEKGANPSHANNEGKAPFHAAIENNNFKAIALLLRYTTKLSNVPVSKLNNSEQFKFVSDHIPPPTLTSADPDGNSLLHYAVRYGFPDSVATLLVRGVDGSLANCKKETAMHIAAERGCQRSVRLLIQYHYTSDVENVDKQTPLHCAASEGHLNIVKDLIECNSNISLKGCLHYAAKSGHTETVQHLVSKGAVTKETDCQSDTPLHLACESGNIKTVKVLLSSSADVNAVGHKGRTPLHIACARGYYRIVDYLLDHGADPNMKNKFNNTPLLSAVVEGHLDVIKLMMLKGAKSQIAGANGSNYLIACCMRGHKDVVRYLIENGADISSKDIQCISPLSVSLSDIVQEERENIDCILKTGRSGIEGMTSLHAAMDGNHFDLAEYLINQGADVLDDDQYGKSILLKVCEKGNLKVTKAFLSSESVFPSILRKDIIEGFSMKNIPASQHSEKKSKNSLSVREIGNDVLEVIDEPDTEFVPVPPVKEACDCGHDDVASVLIAYSAGWLSDMGDSHLYECKSPLHLAFDAGFKDIVACLLSSSTNSYVLDSHGYTIFHKACEHGDVKVFKTILKLKGKEKKHQLHIKTKYGEMFCHIASRKGYMHILKMCLKIGMDLTHVTEEGDNALHLACSYDKHRVCAFLLDTSPSLAWIRNHKGFTPLDIVMRRGNNKLARIFFAHERLTQCGRMQNVVWMYLRQSMEDINRLNLLVRCSNVMDLTDDHGNTPFHVASMVSSNRATECLLKHDKKDCVKLKNRNGDTPLHIASEQGHSAVVRSLLTQCHVSALNNYNETALHLSSLHAHLDTVVALLGAGACVDSRNFQGDSPLHLLLCGCTNKPNNDLTHIITILRHCLASGTGPCQNDLGNTPLHVACCTGKIVIVGELLSGYKDLCMRNTFGKTPLHVACERGQSVIVDLLLEVMWLRKSFGEEFNDFMNHQDAVNGSTPLHLASRCSGQAVLLLVEHGANTTIKDNDGNTPICVAYLTGQKENVKHLLPHTICLHINDSGDTLLHAACRSDQTDMFQIIIDWLGSVGPKIAGNTVNASNCTRQTSLHLASTNGNSYFVEQLLLMGAMPNNSDTSRKTALQYACIGRFVLVVAHLLKHGAHVNVCDDFIRTSLHYACEGGSLDIAEMLTKAGGDPYIRDKDGRTPLDLCSHQHRAIIMKSLRFKRKRQSTCSGDPQYSSKRARCDDTYRRGCTFEDTETCQHTRSVSHFRRSLSVGETPRRVSSDDLCLQKE